MNFHSAYEETDAVIAPIIEAGAESDRGTVTAIADVKSTSGWRRWEISSTLDEQVSRLTTSDVIEIGLSNATGAANLIVTRNGLARDPWPDRLVHRLDEGRIVNSTYGIRSGSGRSFRIESIVSSSPDSTAPIVVPDVVVAVRDPLAGYERYVDSDWDCYGAEPILALTIEAARQLLDMLPGTLGEPHISPGSDGTIGFEWVFAHGPLRKLFIDVGPGRVWAGYWRRASGEKQTLLPRAIDARIEAELGRLFDNLST